MKKNAIFFLPAALLTAFCCVPLLGGTALQPIAWAALPLLWCSGFLLSRRVIWGAFCGAVPGLLLIWEGTRSAHLLCAEIPIGLALLLFFMFCVCAVYQRS